MYSRAPCVVILPDSIQSSVTAAAQDASRNKRPFLTDNGCYPNHCCNEKLCISHDLAFQSRHFKSFFSWSVFSFSKDHQYKSTSVDSLVSFTVLPGKEICAVFLTFGRWWFCLFSQCLRKPRRSVSCSVFRENAALYCFISTLLPSPTERASGRFRKSCDICKLVNLITLNMIKINRNFLFFFRNLSILTNYKHCAHNILPVTFCQM